jgi:hypothetical protein
VTKILTVRISVRFKRGIPRQLTKLATKDGRRRAEWMRAAVLDRVTKALDGHELVPLSHTTADGIGEVLLIRLTPADFKRTSAAAKKEGVALSTYVRAICTYELDAAGTAPKTSKARRVADPMYRAGAARDARRARKEQGQ